MALSKNGLADRDRRVIGRFVEIGLPVAITMAGGYAPDVQDIVDIHLQTIETVLAFLYSTRLPYRDIRRHRAGFGT